MPKNLLRRLYSHTIGDMFRDVLDFNYAMGVHISARPEFPEEKIRSLRRILNKEEFRELEEAEADEDIEAVADAIADLIYVLIGQAIAYGIPLHIIWKEVQSANMRKLWTKSDLQEYSDDRGYEGQNPKYPGAPYTFIVSPLSPHMLIAKDANGKVRKPPSWTPPRIHEVIQSAKEYPMSLGIQPTPICKPTTSEEMGDLLKEIQFDMSPVIETPLSDIKHQVTTFQNILHYLWNGT